MAPAVATKEEHTKQRLHALRQHGTSHDLVRAVVGHIHMSAQFCQRVTIARAWHPRRAVHTATLLVYQSMAGSARPVLHYVH
eukprot:14810761-Alexandrium_andersonii.AAC.1